MKRTGRALTMVVAGLLAVAAGAEAMPVAIADGATPGPPARDPVEVAPRSKRLYVITDSVGLGAQYAIPRAFPPDWEITLDGDAGEFTETLERNYVRPRLTTTPAVFGDHAIVAAGYNYPYWDPGRFDASVDSMISTLAEAGVQYVHWVTLREVRQQDVSPAAWRQVQRYNWYFPIVNDHLEQALERHPNLSLVDWAAVANQPGLTYDAIHLNNTGSALYSSIIRESVDAVTTQVGDGSITRIAVPDAAGTGAVAINVTAIAPRTVGYLTAWSCDGAPPTASFHNSVRADVVAHSTIVPLNASGEFCIATRVATNLVVDLTGRFPTGGGYVPIGPTRWADTRLTGTPVPSGGSLVLDLADLAGVDPSAVGAVAIDLTATRATGPGYLVASATCSGDVETSNVNYGGGDTIPNLVIVEPDDAGTVCITALTQTDVVVDLIGVFAPFAPVTASAPARVADTRDSGRLLPAGTPIVIDAASVGASAGRGGLVLNLTAVGAVAPGYTVASPCVAGNRDVSQLNMPDADAVSNAVIVAPDERGEVCVSATAGTSLIVDVMGTIGPAFEGNTPIRLLDTRAPAP